MSLKPRKSFLLGTSALVCLALAAPVMADDFVITSGSDTNGQFGDGDINGGHTVSLGIALTTTGANKGIKTTGGTNTLTVTETGSIKTTGQYAYGIYNVGNTNTATISGSITTTGDGEYGLTSLSSLLNSGNNNKTTVSGSITTTGTDAIGIYNSGNNNTTTVSGTVKAAGASSAALYIAAGDENSFALDEGAIIIGDILATDHTDVIFDATNSKLIFNLGASTSYAYSVSGKGEGKTAGQWDFSDLDGRTQELV